MATPRPVPAETGQKRAAGGRLATLALALVSSLLVGGGLLVAELSLRSTAATGPEVMRQLHTYSEVYGWKPRAGFQGVIEGGRTTINALSLRGPLPGKRSSGERRILTVGDSIAFGWGAHDHETFSSRLDAEPDLEVLNLAVEGYGVDQSLLRLEGEGLAYGPDAVVLHFCQANDFVDPSLPAFLYDGRTPKPFFVLRGGQLELSDGHLKRTRLERARAGLLERSALLRWFADGRRAPEPEPDLPHWTQTAREVLEDPAAVELTVALVARMAERARQSGARFLLVLHPNRRAFEGQDLRAAALARAVSPSVRVVDMSDHYRERGVAFADIALDAMGHLSPRGHQEVARALRPLLRD